jgi:hypothetical protein
LNLRDGIYISNKEVFTPIETSVTVVTSDGTREQEASVPFVDSNERQEIEAAKSPAFELIDTPFGDPVPPESPLSPQAEEVDNKNAVAGDEDDVASVSTEDPVTMAMRATLNVSDEEDGFADGDDEILYPHQHGAWNT